MVQLCGDNISPETKYFSGIIQNLFAFTVVFSWPNMTYSGLITLEQQTVKWINLHRDITVAQNHLCGSETPLWHRDSTVARRHYCGTETPLWHSDTTVAQTLLWHSDTTVAQ